MDVDIGLDTTGLSFAEQIEAIVSAARLGYATVWTAGGVDPFQTCALRWYASREARPEGIGTAIGIVPVTAGAPANLAARTAALSTLSGGRFILGIGAGSLYSAEFRRAWGIEGIEETSPLAVMRAYLTTIPQLLAGEAVTYEGGGVTYRGARIPGAPAPAPVYVGALGPEMLRLTGELADGVSLSWCTADHIPWVRERVAEGAQRAGRDPSSVTLANYVRVCIDDDVEVARLAVARALIGYVIGYGGSGLPPYRTHFERMGFAAEVAELDEMRSRGMSDEEILPAFPARMLDRLGYAGPAAGAAEAVEALAGEADRIVVRIVPARGGVDSVQAILDACRPLTERVRA